MKAYSINQFCIWLRGPSKILYRENVQAIQLVSINEDVCKGFFTLFWCEESSLKVCKTFYTSVYIKLFQTLKIQSGFLCCHSVSMFQAAAWYSWRLFIRHTILRVKQTQYERSPKHIQYIYLLKGFVRINVQLCLKLNLKYLQFSHTYKWINYY